MPHRLNQFWRRNFLTVISRQTHINEFQNKTGHSVYSTFSTCPVFINNLMVSVRTRLSSWGFASKMHTCDWQIFQYIQSSIFMTTGKWAMLVRRASSPVWSFSPRPSAGDSSDLIGPCRRFPAHVEAQATASSELRKESDLTRDDVSD